MTVTFPSSGYYCTRCGVWVSNTTNGHSCPPLTYPSTSSNTVSWYPNNFALEKKLDEVISLLKKLPTTDALNNKLVRVVAKIETLRTGVTVQSTTTNHKYPIGEKVRLINGNKSGQWGTVAQHLLNGQYLVENTWLENDPMKNKESLPTYQVLAEELIRPLAALLTCADLKVGDVVKYLDGINNYYRSQSGTYTVTAVGEKNVMLSGLDWLGKEVEFSHDPADLEPAVLDTNNSTAVE